MGIALFWNIVVIYWKITKGQNTNAMIDAIVLAFVLWIFSGSFAALAMGTIASALFSMFLIIKPPPEEWFEDTET